MGDWFYTFFASATKFSEQYRYESGISKRLNIEVHRTVLNFPENLVIHKIEFEYFEIFLNDICK